MSANLPKLAALLRSMHQAIQPLGFMNQTTGAEVYHLSADRDRFLALLTAADALEAPPADESDDLTIAHMDGAARGAARADVAWVKMIRAAARAEIAEAPINRVHVGAIEALCRRLGVKL